MAAYYNEIDPYAAQWLRNLIDAGHIAPGDVDERSIMDVKPDDLRGYQQAHFFAGIGGWSIALRLAGWPDDRPVWTGSCPCQPFSAAGAGKAANDERHLWPAWFPLIRELRPAIVFGEQVEAAVGWGWLDAVFADLEGEGYACGASVLPACGVGAPHIRQRLWFVADTDARGWSRGRRGGVGAYQELEAGDDAARNNTAIPDTGAARTVAHSQIIGRGQGHQDSGRSGEGTRASEERRGHAERGDAGTMGHASGSRFQERDGERRVQRETLGPSEGQAAERRGNACCGFWSDAEWIACTDGKARPVGPGSFPLGHGIRNRASKLRAYGNAIVPQVAAEFIKATS